MRPRSTIKKVHEPLQHKAQHHVCHARINAEEEGVAHNAIGTFESAVHAVVNVHVAWLFKDVAAKNFSRFNIGSFEKHDKLVTRNALPDSNGETEPARIGSRVQCWQD